MTPLDDASAIHILKTIAQARLHQSEPAVTQDALEALAVAFGAASTTSASDGDLARSGLDLLAQDLDFAEHIESLAQHPASTGRDPYRFDTLQTIGLTTAAILALQTRVHFRLDNKGKWSLDIDHKSLSDGALKVLVERILSRFGL